jgi:predicted MPP superfamily phosphohydrolase
MIVSGGLGTSVAPVRLAMPPEIVHIVIYNRFIEIIPEQDHD